ncbi:hypothetical protein [Tessaracoccus massiliensis]|uniref:hypothetical protein n=1 Tax=Tessaracoccus massiliensis TaxID=1522311 RepID=UPI00111A3415|nr:hypothetical protein [Tessaracoccus massiliensis]
MTLSNCSQRTPAAYAPNPLHAWRARQFLARLHPEMAAKLAPAVDYRPRERWFQKFETSVYETVARYREWRNPRLPA